jgi:ribonuclease HII
VEVTDYIIRFSDEANKEDIAILVAGLADSLGASKVAGVDEVGRGSLFGDVVAACVVLPADHGIIGITDSKKISEKKRIKLEEEITAISNYGIGVATCEEVDKFNIRKATHMAVLRAYTECAAKCDIDLLLCDGGLDIRHHINIPSRSIVKGDLWSEQIGAASIVAKVFRDNQMEFYHDIWPEYGLQKHKGYGTKYHREAISEHGITYMHRKTFGICKEMETLAHRNRKGL